MEGFDALKVRKEIVEWIRGWFAENGPKATAVIGISGGKDSTICAALLKLNPCFCLLISFLLSSHSTTRPPTSISKRITPPAL